LRSGRAISNAAHVPKLGRLARWARLASRARLRGGAVFHQSPAPPFPFFNIQHIEGINHAIWKIHRLTTSQDSPAYVWHTARHAHAAGKGSIVVPVKLPKTMHQDGFPTESFAISVTPSQPCAVSVSDQTRYGFDVTLTSLNGGALAAGSFSVLVVG
jgi:hypothetical protein